MDFTRMLRDHNQVLGSFFQKKSVLMEKLIDRICESLEAKGKILVFGNGGSAAQAQHFAAEVVNRFLFERGPLPAISLTTDTSILTSVANDVSFEHIFRRQIDALGETGDVALGLSTSGESKNIIAAFQAAREKEMITVALTGKSGGHLAPLADFLLDVPSSHTPRIQETHLFLLHIIAEEIEKRSFVEEKT
jgi:D-sedoheptulose 7-phosphate isomerase